MLYSQRITYDLRFQGIIWGGKNWQVKHEAPHFCNYLPFASLLVCSPVKGRAELQGEDPREELSSSASGNVLILKGSKGHQ